MLLLFATRRSGWKMVQDILRQPLPPHKRSIVPTFLLCGFQTPWFLYFCMQRNNWANQTPLNIPYFFFSVHSPQLTLNWPNKQFNCMLTTDSCTFICWNQTGLIYAWPIALSRFTLFSREKSKTKESEIGELYFGLLQLIFVVSKFGIYLTWPVAHDKAKCLSCWDDDTLSRLREGGNFQTGDRLW